MTNTPLAVILPNIRSAQNVGSILRTADAAGVELIITCGYTPHVRGADDTRPAHVIASNTKDIAKTALGAEQSLNQLHFDQISDAIAHLKGQGFEIVALEQSEDSTNLFEFKPNRPTAVIVGNEVDGIASATLARCDHILELPMVGRKESLNVSVAAGIALYWLRFGVHGKIDL